MKKKIFSYIVVGALLMFGVYMFIDHDKTKETRSTSTPPCHIDK